MQQQADFLRQAYSPLMGNNRAEREGRVVEGTITDLDEERQKRPASNSLEGRVL
ncbi:hypothetical protein [Dictyobacter formicarum]|uniref:Uncharacterized protein n=1 Tax=Dictyobacter formicarum TaxID=2778368 RepID=A0ABQ3VVZ7_9CHLR|nr:hypothetical protein [Dictyobacter formicarum]GHO89854.1 hypothetical protein KSZ_78600 [Dictyobacter formicarum]